MAKIYPNLLQFILSKLRYLFFPFLFLLHPRTTSCLFLYHWKVSWQNYLPRLNGQLLCLFPNADWAHRNPLGLNPYKELRRKRRDNILSLLESTYSTVTSYFSLVFDTEWLDNKCWRREKEREEKGGNRKKEVEGRRFYPREERRKK